MSREALKLKSGDVVEIRSPAQIRRTLDSTGALDGLPFMAEMQRYCGRRFRVFRRADKVCVERDGFLDYRRLQDAVLLEEVRCDGSAHDGCQRLCVILWKEAWLQRAAPGSAPEPPIRWVDQPPVGDVPATIDETRVYSCQSTALLGATAQLREWDIRQYLRDWRSGAFSIFQLLRVLLIVGVNRFLRTIGYYYDWSAFLGTADKTPSVALDLRPGETVRIREKQEIIATLDRKGRNRGLYFGVDMNRHCGRTARVIVPVKRMILETTGKMKPLNNTVLLEGTECAGICNRGCARAGHPLWREAWLERTHPKAEEGRATVG